MTDHKSRSFSISCRFHDRAYVAISDEVTRSIDSSIGNTGTVDHGCHISGSEAVR